MNVGSYQSFERCSGHRVEIKQRKWHKPATTLRRFRRVVDTRLVVHNRLIVKVSALQDVKTQRKHSCGNRFFAAQN